MDRPPLEHLLGQGSASDPYPEALARVVVRGRRRRSTRLRVLASCGSLTLAVALGLGLGLGSGPPLNSAARGTPRLKLFRGAVATPAPADGSASSPTSSAAFSAAEPANDDLCSVAGCSGGVPRLRQLFVRMVRHVEVAAYLVSSSSSNPSGRYQPLQAGGKVSEPLLPLGLPLCERAEELLVQISSGGHLAGQVAVPVVPAGVSGALKEVAESVVTPAGTGQRRILLATAQVSRAVALVTARFEGAEAESTRPRGGFAVLVAWRRTTSERTGVHLIARSSSGRLLGRSEVPRPSLVGLPSLSCRAPDG